MARRYQCRLGVDVLMDRLGEHRLEVDEGVGRPSEKNGDGGDTRRGKVHEASPAEIAADDDHGRGVGGRAREEEDECGPGAESLWR